VLLGASVGARVEIAFETYEAKKKVTFLARIKV
jgi:hypothetical protein